MKRYGYYAVVLSSLLLTNGVWAVSKSQALALDARIERVSFEDNNVVAVHASTFTTTQIRFGEQEVIENIQNGDVDAWTVSVQPGLGNMLFLKPTVVGSDTNMTVITNRHSYYFHLMSAAHDLGKAGHETYAIHFEYPKVKQRALLAHLKSNQHHALKPGLAGKRGPDYHFDYRVSGDPRLRPVRVFDDGRFTYLQFPAHQPIPAIFAVNNAKGDESLVNVRREGEFIVVQQLAPQFTLRQGKHHVASVFNARLIGRAHTLGGR